MGGCAQGSGTCGVLVWPSTVTTDSGDSSQELRILGMPVKTSGQVLGVCVCVCVGGCEGVYVCTSVLHVCEPVHMWVGVKIHMCVHVHEHVWIAHTRVCEPVHV